MDLLSEQRSLIHTGKLLRPPESGIGNTWTETFVLLFDNYCAYIHLQWCYAHIAGIVVMTKSRDKDGVLKYQVNRRVCIPLSSRKQELFDFLCLLAHSIGSLINDEFQ